MDKAAALLGALRTAAGLGDRLDPARVEALAAVFGLGQEELPALVARWQRAGQVAVAWGGVLEVLPEPPAGASVVSGACAVSNRTAGAKRETASRGRPAAMPTGVVGTGAPRRVDARFGGYSPAVAGPAGGGCAAQSAFEA